MMFRRSKPIAFTVAVMFCAVTLSGCSTLVSRATQGFADSLSAAVLNGEDIELVRDGAPSYLILIDALLEGSPDSVPLLLSASQLNSAYAGGFVDDPLRAQQMHSKAKALALRAVCKARKACALETMPFAEFSEWLSKTKEKDIELLYGLGGAWTGWIQAYSEDFNAIAQLSRAKALIERVTELAPSHDAGGAYLYLGVFETLVPPALGGRPEVGRAHFERAIEFSDGRNLLPQVMFAEFYARLLYDRELHDKLLQGVLDADPTSPGYTLSNRVAQQRAQGLMDSADDYFF